MVRRVALASLLIVLWTVSARADGFYVGFAAGRSGVEVDIGTDGAILDHGTFGWRAFGGYDLSRFVAVETGYVSFGTAQDVVGGVSASQDLWGWDVTGLVKLGIGPLQVHARFGGIYWKAALDVGRRKITYDVSDGIGAVYGGGIGVSIGNLSARAEVVRHEIESTGDPVLWSLGVTIGF